MLGKLLKPLVAAALVAALLAAPVSALDESSWSDLESLKPGERVGVIRSDGRRLEGRFRHVTDSAISLLADAEVAVPKDDVVRVYRPPRARRGTRAIVGAAIGVAAGAVLNGTVGARFRNEGGDVSPGVWIGGSAAIGAALGAVTGGGAHTLYRRPGP